MNREILFKGQTESDKRVFGSLVQSKDGKCYIIQQTDNPIDADHDHWHIKAPAYKVKPETVKQYTGQSDINANMVWDGSKIKNVDNGLIQTVYWNNDKSAWYCKYDGQDRVASLCDSLGNLNEVIVEP